MSIAEDFAAYRKVMAEHIEKLERENAALKQRILDDNKAYGCELMDPSETIWDHAKRLQQENAALRVDKERLDWLERNGPWDRWIDPAGPDITLRKPIRECIDAARKEAQP